MKQLVFETRYEDLLSRIPSLFAYILFNDDGTSTLYQASESLDGSYGKIVENLALPCDVNLCTYVQIDPSNAPTEYQWNQFNTFESNVVVENKYDVVESQYIRRVNRRYYEETEYSDTHVYEEMETLPVFITSTDPLYVKTPKLDKLGRYMYDCDGNKIYNYYQMITIYDYFVKKCILEEGGTYTYRTLISFYYKFKDVLPETHPFIVFMERGIGKHYIDKVRLGFTDETLYSGIPEYVYLGQVRQILTQYKHYQRLCRFYTTHYLNMGVENAFLERKCKEYERMGGDRMTDYLETLVDLANRIASEYLCYTNNRAFDLSVDYSIPLFQSKNDLGYMSTYMNEFVPGMQYYHGDLLTYNGRTYITILNRYVPNGNNYEYVKCNDKFYKLSTNGYNLIEIGYPNSVVLPVLRYDTYDFIYFGGFYYRWVGGEYVEIEMVEYTTGKWNENLDINEFDDQHMILLSEYVENDAETLAIPNKITLPNNDKWYSQNNTYGTSFKIFVDVQHIPTSFIHKYVRKNGSFYVWDEEYNSYVPDMNFCESYTISGIADSQLKSLRIYEDFIDGTNLFDTPGRNEDWLYYYKIGNTAAVRVITDEVNNIKRFTDTTITIGQYVTDLMAYGTYLIDIECDRLNHKIKFTYVVNGHLKAVLNSVSADDDGNAIYNYGDFEYDSDDTHGVVYTEEYSYSDADIDELYDNGDFTNFVNNNIDLIDNYMTKYGYKKFAFVTNEVMTSAVYFNETLPYSYIASEYVEEIENKLDYLYNPLYKRDYFVGYSYEPTVNSGVNINRGNGASYERHIKLGEVKTFNDLSEYSNGGFFTMTES